MAFVIASKEQQPILDLNTTPLIDVMLVLLIMFIITIPIQTHVVKIDVPVCSGCPKPRATSNEIRITSSGAILWNDASVGGEGLRYELTRTNQMQPAPELHLRPDAAARYEVVGKDREQVEAAIAGRDVSIAVQAQQKGTGHAVQQAEAALSGYAGPVVILYGDAPFVEADTLRRMVDRLNDDCGPGVVVLAFRP